MHIIDFHTHIFPDKIAAQAIKQLAEESGEYRPMTDGTLQGLIASMDKAGVRTSIVANIATRPTQMLPVFEFCKRIQSRRIIPFISFHPDNSLEDVNSLLANAAQLGIRGVKLHPMYQEFFIDEERMFPFYRLIEQSGMFVVFHTGFDIAFPGNLQADVERVKRLAGLFKGLTIVATHVGGWRQWDRASTLADCGNVYTETSMTMNEMDDDGFIALISQFDENRVLFGTDSPWTDQKTTLDRTLKLKMPDSRKEKMLFRNAERLLGLNDSLT